MAGSGTSFCTAAKASTSALASRPTCDPIIGQLGDLRVQKAAKSGGMNAVITVRCPRLQHCWPVSLQRGLSHHQSLVPVLPCATSHCKL